MFFSKVERSHAILRGALPCGLTIETRQMTTKYASLIMTESYLIGSNELPGVWTRMWNEKV